MLGFCNPEHHAAVGNRLSQITFPQPAAAGQDRQRVYAVLQVSGPIDAQPVRHPDIPVAAIGIRDLALDVVVAGLGVQSGKAGRSDEAEYQAVALIGIQVLLGDIHHDLLASPGPHSRHFPRSRRACFGRGAGGNKKIVVDISEQHLYAYEGDRLVFSFVASTGLPGLDTQPGNYNVQSKIPNAYGGNWNIWMPHWLGIYWAGYLENGIHSLPILPGGSRLWEGYLGQPISYGCVVLGIAEAEHLWNWAAIGDSVLIQQ